MPASGGVGMILSERLQFIFDNLKPGLPVWDFCCDHGYLGGQALKSGRFPEVVFVDQVPHIIANIQEVVFRKFPEHRSRARFISAKGEEITEVVQGNVIIAGVGAFVILRILKSLCDRGLLQAERLLLCPQRDQEKLLTILQESCGGFSEKFLLEKKTTLLERHRSRTVFVFERSTLEQIK